MKKSSIAVIGQGFVGGSLTTVFAERGFTVYAYDKSGKYVTGATGCPGGHGAGFPDSISELILDNEVKDSGFSNVYFVCVPTPMRKDGSADLSIVENVLDDLSSIPGERIAVVKSTVPPGSTDSWNRKYNDAGLHVVFNPEFLTEANALDDTRNQNRIILGGPRPHINTVKNVFQTAFPNVPIIKTSSTTAEMVKYVTNIHLAVKVSLANEFYQICQSLDSKGANIDYDKVIEYALHDARLGTSHWKVPGPMPADDTGELVFGFGGSCFVKDINALMHQAESLGVNPKVMRGAWEKNLEVRPGRDWEKLRGRAITEEK